MYYYIAVITMMTSHVALRTQVTQGKRETAGGAGAGTRHTRHVTRPRPCEGRATRHIYIITYLYNYAEKFTLQCLLFLFLVCLLCDWTSESRTNIVWFEF